ncbi:hypothetical protein SAMN05421774_101631 [Gemmobacter megaterium]|uniref:Uncharacterized protein n=1 Tax=Gemmobacter megaterium TaxID=1086013 RepID=A0A1N7KRW3_9RHOB|nr:hypothetical protein [Gemmobacter megaterium]GGE03467.1 hypothetical protein GCM10011345_06160 [Gemmobacter megaterium]SIS64180.1 hypothetical protein SAMN05421774_101631 [Gemmobacter megaterium]
MALIEELVDTLSADVYAAMQETGDDRLHERVAKAIGALSPTMEEAFLTSMRLRLAELRGRQFFMAELARLNAPQTNG